MRQMISFDFELIKQKKWMIWLIVLGSLIYVLIGSYIYPINVNVAVILSMAACGVNTYLLMSILLMHSLSSNLMGSNYSLCRYFPVKRSIFILSKCFFILVLILLQSLETFVMLYLATAIFHEQFEISIAVSLCTAQISMIFLVSGVNMLTSVTGKGLFLGMCISFGFMGGFSNSLAMDIKRNEAACAMGGWLVVGGICLGLWLVSLLMANLIAKHSG